MVDIRLEGDGAFYKLVLIDWNAVHDTGSELADTICKKLQYAANFKGKEV